MSQHYLIVAVLQEMDRIGLALQNIVETQPEDWKEGYASYRRQLGLSITELVNLARQDLGLSKKDGRFLNVALETSCAAIARHQEAHPLDDLSSITPEFVESFNQTNDCCVGFRSAMQLLVERYEVELEHID